MRFSAMPFTQTLPGLPVHLSICSVRFHVQHDSLGPQSRRFSDRGFCHFSLLPLSLRSSERSRLGGEAAPALPEDVAARVTEAGLRSQPPPLRLSLRMAPCYPCFISGRGNSQHFQLCEAAGGLVLLQRKP